MKRFSYPQLFGLVCGLGLLLSGCLFKPARVPTRYFTLASMPAPKQALAVAPPVPVEVGLVSLPGYLLRDSLAVRRSATELAYLDNALWAERLDLGFRRTLAQNLALLLAAGPAPSSAATPKAVKLRVSVTVEQFDVDTQGRATLLAQWRLTAFGTGQPLKSGQARLTRPGPAPGGHPQLIAAALSALISDFSRELAPVLRKATPAQP